MNSGSAFRQGFPRVEICRGLSEKADGSHKWEHRTNIKSMRKITLTDSPEDGTSDTETVARTPTEHKKALQIRTEKDETTTIMLLIWPVLYENRSIYTFLYAHSVIYFVPLIT